MSLYSSPSLNLRKYWQAQLVVQLLMAAVALQYCVAAALLDGPVMDPADFGPYVTSVKAEVSSWPILLVSMLYILGILINGNWKWSPALRLFCAVFHVVTLFLFAYLSWYVSPVDPFVASCMSMGFANLILTGLNLGDCVRALRGVR